MPITTHTELLNALIEKHNLKSYLEIGVQNPANNFNKIKCKKKIGVDPCLKGLPDPAEQQYFHAMTSDEYFERFKHPGFMNYDNPRIKAELDLIFIDGLHHADQVKRDFGNSLKCLNDGGFIAIHDVLPENEIGTRVPRETLVWWGDVYKFAMSIRNNYSDIRFKTFNITNGLMLIWKEPGYTYTTFNEPMTWETYQKHGHQLLNVVDY